MPFGTSLKSAGALVTGDLHKGQTAAEATEDKDPSERFTFVVEIKSCGATASAPICIPATSSAMSEGDCLTTREFAGGAATSDQLSSHVTEEATAWSMKQLQTKARFSLLPSRRLFAMMRRRRERRGQGRERIGWAGKCAPKTAQITTESEYRLVFYIVIRGCAHHGEAVAPQLGGAERAERMAERLI